MVKISDKKAAKTNGILTSPGLTYFKGGEATHFEGDFSDIEAIVDFLASDDALELPDRIEDVNSHQLEKMVQDRTFVAAIFCKCLCFIKKSKTWIVCFF